ncbi:tetraspanin-7-like [Gigantopelta aegis]|uniref:tetraspanin-7-like n=1 Tax=Gigantopelta aegis TaxID=1735272 RepID=UPI001B88AC13|nr:tetraspanin-7-like [Gigantopelta aegis]
MGKLGLDCAGKTARFLLILFNTIFVLSGIAVLGSGIWLRVDPNVVQLQRLVELNTDTNYLTAASYVFIGFGGAVLLVGVFGCCGGILKNKWLLGVYIALLVLIFIGEISAGIIAAIFRAEVMSTVKRDLLFELKKEYRPGRTKYTQPWDYTQVWLECCGVNNYTDYRHVFPANGTRHVPDSCCVLTNRDPDDPIPKDPTKCQADAMNSELIGVDIQPFGCIDAITNKIKEYNGILLGIGIGIAFIQVLGIVLACCLCRKVDKYAV